MSKLIASLNPFVQTDKTKNKFQNATDTLTEVVGLFIVAVLVAGALFAFFEGKDYFTSVWWAVVTGFTVGYGDIAPITVGGRLIGTLLMTFSTWIILPLIIVTFIKKHSPDRNEFTNQEQIELLEAIREIKNNTAKRTKK